VDRLERARRSSGLQGSDDLQSASAGGRDRPGIHDSGRRRLGDRTGFQPSPAHVHSDGGRPSAAVDLVGDAGRRPRWSRRRAGHPDGDRRSVSHPAAVHPAAGRDPADAADTRRAAAARAEQRARRRADARRHRTHSAADVREPERAGDRHHRPVVDPGGGPPAKHHRSQTADVRVADSASARSRGEGNLLEDGARQPGGGG